MSNYDSYRVLAGRIRMHVLEWAGDDPSVVFLHSLTANGLAALPLGNLLVEHHRLIAPDLRGRGQSDSPFGEYGLHVHVRDVIACMNRLEIERCVMAGHSFGAMIAVLLASEHPDRVSGLMLFDGGAGLSEDAFDALSKYYDNLNYHYPSADDYIDVFRHLPLYQPFTAELEALIRSNLYQQPDGSYIRNVPRYVLSADRRVEHLEMWRNLPELYKKIHCPVLMIRAGMGITGKTDQVLDDTLIARMQSMLPQTKVVTVEEAGHTSILTLPSKERDDAILEFLRQIP